MKAKKIIAFAAIFVIILSLFSFTMAAEEADLKDYDNAIGYLDEYTTKSNEDANFAENSATALETVREEIPLFSTFWALL